MSDSYISSRMFGEFLVSFLVETCGSSVAGRLVVVRFEILGSPPTSCQVLVRESSYGKIINALIICRSAPCAGVWTFHKHPVVEFVSYWVNSYI